jgi:F-type H+-transporting ATPase subunit epsilon
MQLFVYRRKRLNFAALFHVFSYLQYVSICSRALRNSLKEEARVIAQRRDENVLKYAKWENGKQGESVSVFGSPNDSTVLFLLDLRIDMLLTLSLSNGPTETCCPR